MISKCIPQWHWLQDFDSFGASLVTLQPTLSMVFITIFKSFRKSSYCCQIDEFFFRGLKKYQFFLQVSSFYPIRLTSSNILYDSPPAHSIPCVSPPSLPILLSHNTSRSSPKFIGETWLHLHSFLFPQQV